MKDEIIKVIRLTTDKWGIEINESTDLWEDLGLDDLDSVELLMAIETKFEITINDDKWDKCTNVEDVLKLIKETLTTKK